MKITKNCTLKRNPEIISSKIDDEVVMMSIEEGKYFGLDPIGSIIWELLEEPKSLKKILPELVDEFDVSEEQCEKDCMSFVLDMIDKKTLIIQ
ncbi:PqqD family peptide modification chaperone [Lentisphaera marina]|uniref:PqqD family peptide modification chaperone n=1 Tax=Lentisphaera marina TaxID=1111041 RepID=UPI002365F495|nr:PqqD family peptide modification chaperone [Lentisphaera marina]MDD7987006.1 PqqD family peptide modification chaperone [Lentisphaera marina]